MQNTQHILCNANKVDIDIDFNKDKSTGPLKVVLRVLQHHLVEYSANTISLFACIVYTTINVRNHLMCLTCDFFQLKEKRVGVLVGLKSMTFLPK